MDLPKVILNKGMQTYVRFTVKTKSNTCFGCETETGVVRILVIFQDRTMFSHINGKLSPTPFK